MRYIPDSIITLYDYSPKFSRNLLATMFGVIKKYKEYNKKFYTQLNEIQENEWKNTTYFEDLQNLRLVNLINYVYREVDYYRDLFNDNGINISQIQNPNDLKIIPLLNKGIIKNNFKKLIPSQKKHKLRFEYTSGTTGSPFRIGLDSWTFHHADALQYQMYLWAGFKFGKDWLGRLAGNRIIPIKDKRPPFWTKNYFLKQLHLSSYHLNDQNSILYADQLIKNNIKFLSGYPSTISLLAKFLEKNNINYEFKAVFLSSEPIYSWQKNIIEKVFNARIYNMYGQAERVFTSVSCGKNLKMHYCPDASILELEPVNSRYKIIATSLLNYGMPLIRYSTEDITGGTSQRCACGRGYPLISPVETKSEDFIINTNGDFLSASVMTFPFKNNLGITEAQIIQNDYASVTVNIVPNNEYSSLSERSLIKELKTILGADMQIDVNLQNHIPRTTNGKFRFVISNIYRKFIGEEN